MRLFNTWKQLPKADRVQFLLSAFIRLSFVAALVVSLIEMQWTVAFVSAIAIIVIMLPAYLHTSGRFFLPARFEFVLLVFVYAALFLGEVHSFYERFWWWDVVLHTGSGMALGFLGFLILFILHADGRFQATPSLIAFLSFSVALSIGTLWEIFEFAMDSFFNLNMQKSGLVDTMWDMIVNAVGAFTAALSGYVYLKGKSRGLGIFRYYLNAYMHYRNGGEK